MTLMLNLLTIDNQIRYNLRNILRGDKTKYKSIMINRVDMPEVSLYFLLRKITLKKLA